MGTHYISLLKQWENRWKDLEKEYEIRTEENPANSPENPHIILTFWFVECSLERTQSSSGQEKEGKIKESQNKKTST